jgi:hypothetical protein
MFHGDFVYYATKSNVRLPPLQSCVYLKNESFNRTASPKTWIVLSKNPKYIRNTRGEFFAPVALLRKCVSDLLHLFDPSVCFPLRPKH